VLKKSEDKKRGGVAHFSKSFPSFYLNENERKEKN